jgi:capsular polysaccharide biosynthesis protein
MDLLSILQAVWRRKLITIPVVLLTLAGAFYVLKLKPPVYQASSSFLLVNPPAGPTTAQIALQPKLAKIDPNNSFANFGNLDLVADVVIDLVTAPSAQEALVQAGVDPRYEAALANDFDSPPLIEITGIGATAQEAIRSADLVTTAAMADLYQMQKSQGINKYYMIKSVQVVQPLQAQKTESGKLRTIIVILALGIILLFLAVSTMDAIEKRRMGRRLNGKATAKTEPQETDRELGRHAGDVAMTKLWR